MIRTNELKKIADRLKIDKQGNGVKTICAWCMVLLRDGKLVDGKVSHGICPKCKKEVLKEG